MALNLEATIGLNSTAFARGAASVQAALGGLVRNFVIGALGVATVEQALARTIQTADELVTASKRLDTTVEQLQVLRQAAKESGVEFDRLAVSLERINVARAKALGGDAGALRAFAALGVNPAMLRSQRAADLAMGPISTAVRAGNAEVLAAPLKEIFGKGFGPMIAALRTDFGELGQSMRNVGAIMDQKTALELKRFKDTVDLIGSVVAAQLAPYLVKAGEAAFKFYELLQYAGAFYGTLISAWMHGQFRGSQTEAAQEGQRVKGQLDQQWAAFQASLNRPAGGGPAPNFEALAREPERPGRRAEKSDALVSVGNFLGADLRGSVAATQQQIAANTKAIAENTRVLPDLVAAFRNTPPGSGTAWGLHQETVFPE